MMMMVDTLEREWLVVCCLLYFFFSFLLFLCVGGCGRLKNGVMTDSTQIFKTFPPKSQILDFFEASTRRQYLLSYN